MLKTGLKKIVLIASFMREKLWDEFDVSLPIQITGDNAVGKTTILKLIPFFNGAPPSLISKQSNVRKSFADWYLPSSNSYIIFEYVNHAKEIVHVICFRSKSSETGVVYLFVKGEFNKDFLLKKNSDGTLRAITRDNLLAELTTYGCEYETRVTSSKEYREIIQNINPQKRHVKYRHYSLCAGKDTLRHVEKVTASLIKGGFSMTDNKALFLDIIQKSNDKVDFGIDPDLFERWANDYTSLKSFLEKESLFKQAIANNKAITSTIDSLVSAYSIINSASLVIKDRLSQEQQILIDLNETYDKEQTDIKEEIDSLDIDKNKKKNALNSVNEVIYEEQAKLDEYLNDGFPQKVVHLSQLHQIKESLESKKEKYIQLASQIDNVKAKRDNDIKDHTSSFNAQAKELADRKLQQQKKYSEKKEKHTEKYNKLINDEKEKHRKAKQAKLDEIIVLKNEISLLTQRKGNPDVDANLLKQKEDIATEKESLLKQASTQKDTISSVEKSLYILHDKRKEQLADLEKTKNNISEAEIELDEVSKRLDGESGSLLAFLEQNMPGWQSSNLGRVLSKKLLMSTALSPKLVEDSNSLFGISIDTSVLPICQVNNADDLKRQVQIADLITRLTEDEQEIAKQIKQSKSEIDKLDTELVSLKAELNKINVKLGNAEQNYTNKKIEVAKAKEALIKNINSSILSTNEKITNTRNQIAKSEEGDKQVIEALTQEEMELRSDLESTNSAVIEEIDAIMSSNDKAFQASISLTNVEYQQRLLDGGISKEVYTAYKEDVERLESLVKSLQRNESKINDFQRWHAKYDHEDKERREKQRKLRSVITTLDTDIFKLENKKKELKTAFISNKTQLINSINELKHKKNRIYNSTTEISNHKSISMHLQNKDETLQNIEQVDINTILNDVDSHLSALNSMVKKRNADLEVMHAITSRFSTGQFESFWMESTNNALKGNISLSDAKKIEILEDILINVVPQIASTLIAEINNTGHKIVGSKLALTKLSNDIKKLGSEISQSISSINRFAVDSFDVKITSKLNKLNGWQEMLTFSSIYNEWEKTGCVELPPIELYNSLKSIVSHIKTGKENITADLFDVEFVVVEGGVIKKAKTDNDMSDLASNGLNLIIQSMLYIALLSKQRSNSDIAIAYPTDEVGKLSARNLPKFMTMMKAYNFNVIAAQPDGDKLTSKLFERTYIVSKDKTITNKPSLSKLDKAKLAEKNTEVLI